ncbi:nucleotide disphospho-sugar-binding domain-containing protein [Amycolatopsis anabasis]|uniref:nucleotide disphospho-sugar-binding domain-containing protein n=1 Tax=Amycolatopsis anabasis TaxID=1840409 RepID=UPI00131BE8E1|nr:nucleotide disphospho-sugar-binding domain-containing protein [Amycolatopsis anabasis]
MRVLFTTVALPGHFFPLVPLAWAFRSAGHEVLVATSEHFVPTALRSGLPIASCGAGESFFELAAEIPATSGLRERRLAHGHTFGRLTANARAGTRALVDSWRPELIVSERAEFAGPLAAAALDVPFVEYQWGVAALAEYRAGAAAYLGLDALPEPERVLNPWPPSLRLAHAQGQQGVRPVPYNGDAHVPGWVFTPREKPRVALTLGTMLPYYGVDGVVDVVLPMLDSLAAAGAEIVVAVDEAVAATWPALPAAVRHAGRLPMAQVLPACDLLIHHGGHGTALTALAAGCPQLVFPHIDDQWDNADAVVRAGAGLRFAPGEIGPETVGARALEVIGGERFGEAAGRSAAEIAAQPGPLEIVSLLEKMAA